MPEYNIKLEIQRVCDDTTAPVHYKADGQRFDVDKTIKLLTEAGYRIDVQIKPHYSNVQCVTVFDKDCDVTAVTRDNGDKCYQCALSTTGVAVSKTGTREPMHIIITFENDTYVTVRLQSKLYADAKGHATWGQQLHFIECSFRTPAPQEGQLELSSTRPVFR